MADQASFTNYQLNSTTLDLMKKAAGNYMPDYGHWRALIKPHEEEEKEEEEEEKEPETGSESRAWGEEGEGGEVVEV